MTSNDYVSREKLFDLSHVTAVVTGGGSGIGLMITQALVANGAKVYIIGRRQEALSRVVDVYSEGPESIKALRADVSQKDEVMRIVKEISTAEPGGIQLLVNNAGVANDVNTNEGIVGEPDYSDAQSISEHYLKSRPEQWEETFKVNVTAPYFMSMAFLPLLAKGQEHSIKDGGPSSLIVNVSSIAGAAKYMADGQPSYASSKAACTHLSRMLAWVMRQTRVRVNVIAPGLFPSEMTAGSSDEYQKSKLEPGATNPAGRKGRDEDIAGTIVFLASKAGAFYNHQILYPDGGNTLVYPSCV